MKCELLSPVLWSEKNDNICFLTAIDGETICTSILVNETYLCAVIRLYIYEHHIKYVIGRK